MKVISYSATGHRASRAQHGAVLLAFMLILIVGSSYMLASRLNLHAREYLRNTRTQAALLQAKQALLFYAMNYPDVRNNQEKGPGFLPCPDTDNDGSPQSNCAVTTGTTLGRLPYNILGLPELTDSDGEALWYSLSDNFKNTQSNDTVINSDTPGLLIVDPGTGNQVADVVAVVIAPGAPVAGQSGRVSNNAADYLEDDNVTGTDADFVTSAGGEFNDRLITITRQELMAVVEKRVLSDVRAFMGQYNSAYGAYPWLSPFADPKAAARWLLGQHTDVGNNPDLKDDTTDFKKWKVKVGDRVWNLSDGSVGTIIEVKGKDLKLGGSLRLGTDNDFDNGDEYVVEMEALADALTGSATADSAGTTLEDDTTDFVKLGIIAGDIVENRTDGSVGIVETVAKKQISVASLTGGTNNIFALGDTYRIRGNVGRATADTDGDGLTLDDTDVDFTVMGVQVGDLVWNITDGSFGRVSAAPTANRITVTALEFGSNNSFTADDYYVLPRLNGVASIREGLLSVHEPGKVFATGFNMDWSATAANGATVVSGGPDPDYDTGLRNWVETSAGTSGTVSVSAGGGQCIWVSQDIANCKGTVTDNNFLSGVADGSFGNNWVYDVGRDFPTAGVKDGDIVQNTTDGLEGIVSQTWPGTFPEWLFVSSITGQGAFLLETNDEYRVLVATARQQDTVDLFNSSSNLALSYGASLANIQVGDVVENVSRGGAVGKITGIFCCFGGDEYFQYSELQGGSSGDLLAGDSYRIHYNYVDRREYKFDVLVRGNSNVTSVNGVRIRDVCLGYSATCGGSPSNTTLPGDSVTPLVTITDFDDNGNPINATVTVPAVGSQGSTRIAGLSYFLDEANGDLPAWFLKNKWQRFIYVALSSGVVPGAGNSCTVGTDCLQLQTATTTRNDREAMVLAAGMQIDGAQDRTSPTLADYFENQNASSGDDVFQSGEITATFNDQVSTIAPAIGSLP